MTDTVSKEQRSINMGKIRSKDTIPELIVRRSLFSKGFRYRIHDKKIIGKPDIVLKKYKTVIFVHGCFWHQHKGCKFFRLPKSNQDYWKPKLGRNKERFNEVRNELIIDGWNVEVIWECETKNEELFKQVIKNLTDRILKTQGWGTN